jgi:TPR repeat protein
MRPAAPASALLFAVLLLACGQDEDQGEKAAKGTSALAAASAAPSASSTGAEGTAGTAAGATSAGAAGPGEPAAGGRRAGPCADFAACRDACSARRSGGCVRMHERSRASDGDRAEAEKTASRLCDAGHPEACHVRHVQLQSDRRRSAQALTRACDLGYGQACVSLAGRTRDKARADELRKRGTFLLDRFCQRDDPYACTATGDLARNPPRGEDPDPARARWHYDKACVLGDGEGCYALVEQLAGEQPARVVVLLDRACELGEPRGCARAGDEYASGERVARNMERASAAWQAACDSGEDVAYRACDSLADALLDGRLPRDQARADKLKQRGEELAGQYEGD